MVEDSRLRRPGSAGVVVRRDRVQDLCEEGRVEPRRPLLDEAKPEMDVAEQLPLGGGEEERPAVQLAHAPGVVQERRGDNEVGAQAWCS